MPDRNNKGWLTVKALLRGEREQYAITSAGVTYTVTLRHEADGDDFVVLLEVRDQNNLVAKNERKYGVEVAEARAHFGRVRAVIRKRLGPPPRRKG